MSFNSFPKVDISVQEPTVRDWHGVPLCWNTLSNTSAFLLPALALWLPSGYSWGAVVLLLASLMSLHRWPRYRPDRNTVILAVTIAAMAMVWLLQSGGFGGSARWDKFSKYALALPCLFFAVAYPPSYRALRLGLVVGCIGAGLIALWQVHGLGLSRASGYTNAIQFGNLALLMATMLALALLCSFHSLGVAWRIAYAAAALLAMQASVLSLSRGGWLALAWLAVLCWPVLREYGATHKRQLRWGLLAIAVLLLAPLASNTSVIKERFDLMGIEVAAYQEQGEASSSIGHRLEHWRLAWHLGQQKPVLGWGDGGYKQEKTRLVEAGLFDVSTTYYDHAHNELLDMLAKRGSVGVAMLLLFYAIPLALFWPTKTRMQRLREGQGFGQGPLPASQVNAVLWLRLCGSAIVLMYIAFGVTQVFFAHNSGTMSYLFMLILFWSALGGLELSRQYSVNRPLQSS